MADVCKTARPLADVALVAEYPWRYGGSQRLLHILARAWDKPIHLLPPARPSPVWNTPTTVAIPDEPVLLSIVVDGLQPRLVPGKKHIKFCHSRSTISRYWDDSGLSAVEFLTHRPRVRDHYAQRGLSITCIPDGYIPYDGLDRASPAEAPGVACCVASRLSPDKVPLELVDALSELPHPTHLAGSQEDAGHTGNVRATIGRSSRVTLVEPDQPNGGISEAIRLAYLQRSKILVHYAADDLKDQLEYSILDALVAGAVPVCVTPDPTQFALIEADRIGRVVTCPGSLPAAIDDVMSDYRAYRAAAVSFMAKFASDQPPMLRRWQATVEAVVEGMML